MAEKKLRCAVYLVRDRKLVVNKPQADVVRHIMQRYLAVGSVVELVDELGREGYRTEVKTSANGNASGGVLYSRGMLFRLLTNPVYRGMTVHKDKVYPGEHDPVVDQELWDQVQSTLSGRTQGHSRRLKAKDPSLLVGILFDGEARPMASSHTLKSKVRYRYYITRPDRIDGSPAWRVSAHDLERLVCERLASLFEDYLELAMHLAGEQFSARETSVMLITANRLADVLRRGHPSSRLPLVSKLVKRVELGSDRMASARPQTGCSLCSSSQHNPRAIPKPSFLPVRRPGSGTGASYASSFRVRSKPRASAIATPTSSA